MMIITMKLVSQANCFCLRKYSTNIQNKICQLDSYYIGIVRAILTAKQSNTSSA